MCHVFVVVKVRFVLTPPDVISHDIIVIALAVTVVVVATIAFIFYR